MSHFRGLKFFILITAYLLAALIGRARNGARPDTRVRRKEGKKKKRVGVGGGEGEEERTEKKSPGKKKKKGAEPALLAQPGSLSPPRLPALPRRLHAHGAASSRRLFPARLPPGGRVGRRNLVVGFFFFRVGLFF